MRVTKQKESPGSTGILHESGIGKGTFQKAGQMDSILKMQSMLAHNSIDSIGFIHLGKSYDSALLAD